MESSRDYSQVEFSEDSILVFQPRFTDESKTKVRAIFQLPNGQLKEIEKSRDEKNSKLVRDVFLQYTEAEIEEFTRREAEVLKKKRAVEERAAERRRQEQQMEAAFQAKVSAMEIPEVRDCPDKQLLRRIRKAKNPLEVAALVAIVLQKSLENGSST